jgi:hypothetical protein
MRLCLRNLRPGLQRRRIWAALCAATLAASVVTVVDAGAASAQAETYIYFANYTEYGMYAINGVTNNSAIATTTPPWGTWDPIFYGTTSEDGVTGPGYEFEAITTKGTASGLCMTTTVEYQQATLGPCGAGGTVFVLASSEGGYIMYSRYFLNIGQKVALASIGSPYGFIQAEPSYELVTGVYYRWAFSSL